MPGDRADARLNRLAVAGLLGATGVAGLLFAPVFGIAALIVPVLVVVLVGYGCVEACARWPRMAPWRPVLVLAGGVLGLIESVLFGTTVAGLPTPTSLLGVWRGLTEGWLRTLQSTWPARPEPDQLLFVPLAVLLALLVGLELLLRLRKQLAALLPSLAVVGLSQAYQALTGLAAVAAAVAYAAPAALLLWAERPGRQGPADRRPGGLRSARRLSSGGAWLALCTAIAVVAGAAALSGLDPADRAPYRLQDSHPAPLRQNAISNPLDEIAQRLTHPDREMFRYRSDAPVDRWRLAVLDGFDGANWTADPRLQRLGVGRDGPAGSTTRTADVRLTDLSGPWLPSQQNPLGVDGIAPLVDQSGGTLLLDQPTAGTDRQYRLSWSAQEVDGRDLGVAPVDTRASAGLGGLGTVPPGLNQFARDAVLGLRPTFQSALQLERFLSKNYQVTVGGELPTGHGWPQLRYFLTDSKRGTSEQFAAAYVVLARLNGIPVRLAVGYRGSTETDGGFAVVRNRDVLAWPEVAVAGVGWVPLDPTSTAAKAGQAQPGQARSDLARAAAQARDQLPPEGSLRPAQLPQQQQKAGIGAADGAGPGRWGTVAAVGALALLLCWLAGVPLAKALRARRRRRWSGADGVVGAWAEARDRLRAHGVPYRVGMTPRDLAELAGPVVGEPTVRPIIGLSRVLDMALWSGEPVTNGAVRRAWDEVGAIRRDLAGRPWSARLRAAVEPRTLLPPATRGSSRR
ncbi:transglutaminase domain-containing protein [Solihabitans fulvus]|uniref:Transglutaminase domain-containing protein n=2 Tax=Solihabitans fulvus TaxID=1892852 RepID=A0A5B2XWJ7_9PSEU|nr:transglutaminase domain-containing protein [Solihabitans fulvus]